MTRNTPTGGHDASKQVRYALGLLSGTSLDGVDAACCRVTHTPERTDTLEYEVEIASFVRREYDRDLRDRLIALCDDETGTVDEVCRMNVAIAEVFADVAADAWRDAGIDHSEVDVIGSHGQTIWHVPDEKSLPGTTTRSRSSLQIGDGCVIAERTGIPTVSDFRTRDIAAGGHGAPLAPFIDAVSFADEESFRAIQNIGGIGNCTLLPPSTTVAEVRAFDTGPGNMVIDAVVELLTDGEMTYDVDGEIAAEGSVDRELLGVFLDDPYFRQEPPKSTGREYFGYEYARRFIAAGRDRDLTGADIVASTTALTARSIADAYENFSPKYPDEIYVSGGGAYNPTLMTLLDEACASPVRRLQELGVEADAKEAMLFALLAATHLDGVPNNIPAATGAERPVVTGKLSPGGGPR